MSNREETDPQDAALVRRRQALGASVLWVTGVAALLTLMGPSLKNTVQVYFVPLATSLEVSRISAGHKLRSFGALAEQDAIEVIFILDGHAIVRCKKATHCASTGKVLVFPEGVWRTTEAHVPTSAIAVHIDDEFLRTNMRWMPQDHLTEPGRAATTRRTARLPGGDADAGPARGGQPPHSTRDPGTGDLLSPVRVE